MEQYALYLVMKSKVSEIDNSIKCSFNDMNSNKADVCGIYIKGGETPKYRELASGKYYNYSARVQFLLQGGNNKDSLMDIMSIASCLRNTLICDSNLVEDVNEQVKWVDGKCVYDPANTLGGSDIQVTLCKVSLLGEVDFKGKTGQGLPKYSINFRIEYYLSPKPVTN